MESKRLNYENTTIQLLTVIYKAVLIIKNYHEIESIDLMSEFFEFDKNEFD